MQDIYSLLDATLQFQIALFRPANFQTQIVVQLNCKEINIARTK